MAGSVRAADINMNFNLHNWRKQLRAAQTLSILRVARMLQLISLKSDLFVDFVI